MKTLLLCVALLLLAIGPVQADPPDNKGKPDKGQQNKGKDDAQVDIDLVFGGIDRATARDLAREFGITGLKPIPPGIRKNLARGKPMPPGIARTRLPEGYIGRLPVHEGYRWDAVGSDLLLVQVASGLVADVLNDVFD
jgi:hypothetical protein